MWAYRATLAILGLLLLVGCLPAAMAPAGPTTTTGPSPEPALAATSITPTVTPTPPLTKPTPRPPCLTPVATPPSVKPMVRLSPTMPVTASVPETLKAWHFLDPRDSAIPDLIVPGENGYRLPPDWKAQRIDYVYKWWGLGIPVFDYQFVEYREGRYQRGTDPVDDQRVDVLIEAVSNLHPSQSLLAGYAGFDNYPSWMIEITGTDGQRILISSASTGNPGSGPWNVLHNGRLYVQYDGSLGKPLADLFPGARGSPAAAFYPGGRSPGSIHFSTKGWPSQLIDGFVGLLPIADGFRYWADPETGEIQGYIEGQDTIGYMKIGAITKLKRVELFADGDRVVPCPFEEFPTPDHIMKDTKGAAWTFTCSPGDVVDGARYRYPIRVEFETDAGERMRTEGELRGVWNAEPGIPLLPVSEDIQAALAEHGPAVDLLTDHVLAGTYYHARISPIDVQSGTLTGEVVLLGQAEIGQTPLRYTVGFPFAMGNGQITRWDLTRGAVQCMLEDITPLALTRRVVDTAPTTILNMWYAAGEPDGSYEVGVRACQDIPAWMVPREGDPLRAFGFNSGWRMWMPDFVLIDGWPVVAELDLWPSEDDRGGLLSILIPPQLDTGELKPFERIWMDSSPIHERPTLTLWIPEDTDVATWRAYWQLTRSFGVPVDTTYDPHWEAKDLTFIVTDEGTLTIVPCAAE